MITIIDYGAGNLGSVDKAFKYLGEEVRIITSPEDILSSKALVLPGVGAFGDTMEKLRAGNFDKAVIDYIKQDRPFLGICLGLQMLFDYSEEGNARGLGVFPGSVKLFPNNMGLKIPQMGWNSINVKPESKLLKGIKSGEYLYFVHSYYLSADDKSLVCAKCNYGMIFDAAIEKGNVFATQFHPEKSGAVGLKVLKNFIELKIEK